MARSGLESRNDVARDDLDLLRLIAVGNEDELLGSDRDMRFELLDAFVDRAHDRALLGRFAPGREVPFLGQPLHHLAFDGLARFADHDRDTALLQLLLGLRPDPVTKTLVSDAPDELPSWLGSLTLSGIPAFERSWDVRLENGHISVQESE